MESMTLVPGVEIGSGSLGHGLGLAVGTALGLRLTRSTDSRVVVLLGDAELEEGSNAEAIQFAGRTRLDQLTRGSDRQRLSWTGRATESSSDSTTVQTPTRGYSRGRQ